MTRQTAVAVTEETFKVTQQLHELLQRRQEIERQYAASLQDHARQLGDFFQNVATAKTQPQQDPRKRTKSFQNMFKRHSFMGGGKKDKSDSKHASEHDDTDYQSTANPLKSTLWKGIVGIQEDAQETAAHHQQLADGWVETLQPLKDFMAVYEKMVGEVRSQVALLEHTEAKAKKDPAEEQTSEQNLKVLERIRELEMHRGAVMLKVVSGVVRLENVLVDLNTQKTAVFGSKVAKIDLDEDQQEFEAEYLAVNNNRPLVDWSRSGPLMKRMGDSGNNWLERHFVLKGEDKKLYIFGQEDLVDVKGVLNLNDWVLHDMHPSYFGDENCFQLARDQVKEADTRKAIFLKAPSKEVKREWMSLIEKFTQMDGGAIKYPRFTEPTNRHKSVIRKMTLEILSGEFNHKEDYECEIGFSEGEDIMVALAKTTPRFNTSAPSWSEKFEFNRVFYGFSKLVIMVYSKKSQMGKRKLVGSVSIDIETRAKLSFMKCLPIEKPNKGGTSTTENLVISVDYTEEKILPLDLYWPMFNSIFSRSEDVSVLKCLSKVMAEEIEPFVFRVLDVLEYGGGPLFCSKIICVLAEEEIRATKEAAVLFRSNSFMTKLAEVFLRQFGKAFLEKTLTEPFELLTKEKESFEIDPLKVSDAHSRALNIENVLKYTLLFWDSIYKNIESLPNEIRVVFKTCTEIIKEMNYTGELVSERVVCGFFFLRFLVPTIATPGKYGFSEENLRPSTRRGLLFIAKSLQCFGNFVEVPKKEEFMAPIISRMREARYLQLLDLTQKLSHVASTNMSLSRFKPGFNVSLSELHKLLAARLPELEQASETLLEMASLVAEIKEVTRVADDDTFFPSASIKGSRIETYKLFTFTRNSKIPEVMVPPAQPPSSQDTQTPALPPPITAEPFPALEPSPASKRASNHHQFATTISSFLKVPPPPPLVDSPANTVILSPAVSDELRPRVSSFTSAPLPPAIGS